MCTAGVKQAGSDIAEGAKSAQKEAERRYQAEAQRASDTNISGKAMEQFEGGMRNVDSVGRVVGDEAGRWGDALAGVMGMGQDKGTQQSTSDTVEANYSKSSSEKSSKSSSKAKKKGGEGTGGSKSQFYAKK